ncbi:hypothetical protein ANI_1_556144 [Paecilomyces variotii No. 5]|uniref:GDS1 winged helix domain-containing protein n=1 Tax=Byssochlamys spectabilis (strain No. 5 / NBRC 109023) TaxID=1356009 RepID=V5FRQ3_BYSSN|nr:hypothetical protein ANI_1_556144 [Paecilomyces variotii No. 5]
MPYNTRRKSLSLPSLGIHLPNASRSHRSPSASKVPAPTDAQLPPSKKVKRSHDRESQSPDAEATGHHGKSLGEQGRAGRSTYEHTPPPSPADGVAPKIDTEGISDDIVVAVIEQLEKTGNRPHLIKELAAVLTTINENVANSANPAALLSSRLSAYLKRPWSALAPCPLAKELIPVHPRKVFYYLTTCAHQPLPETADDLIITGVDGKQMTPSISSLDQDEEDALARQRSPSPEVDLSSPEFEDENMDMTGHHTAGGSGVPANGFSDRRSQHRLAHNHRAASPPLEGDEREFTQTASSVRERTSEERAQRQDSAKGTPQPSEAASELTSALARFSGSPMDEDPLSSTSDSAVPEDQYSDYFSQIDSRAAEQDLDEAAAVALFGTSPSPSLSSTASSISSGTEMDADAELSTTTGLMKLQQNMASSARGASPVSVSGDSVSAPATALKRSIDMLENDFSGVDLRVDLQFGESHSKKPLANRSFGVMAMDFDMVRDPWSELQSPETVEVDELDEMFGDF